MNKLRELDVLVAQKIFDKEVEYVKAIEGYEWPSRKARIARYLVVVEHGVTAYEDTDGTVKLDVVPSYSHSLEAALNIIEKLVGEQMLRFELEMVAIEPYTFRARFGNSEAVADTIPLAIVKAALKWAGVDVEAEKAGEKAGGV